jgi:hypothetical protein
MLYGLPVNAIKISPVKPLIDQVPDPQQFRLPIKSRALKLDLVPFFLGAQTVSREQKAEHREQADYKWKARGEHKVRSGKAGSFQPKHLKPGSG